jgi:oligoribonuclease
LGNHLVWIDLEMTGVHPEKDVILEIATIITDDNLEIVAEGPNIAIRQPVELLSQMDAWCTRQHQSSGLTDRATTSPHDCRAAEQMTLEFLQRYCKQGECLLCGNSIWQDRRFLSRYMPSLTAFFHYRLIDVSSIKELAKRWYPSLPPFEKQKTHMALVDIKESINELKYYREKIFLRR